MKALEHFTRVYRELNRSNLETLRTIYSDDVSFSDPIHRIAGIDSLTGYFTELYQNVDEVSFEFGHLIACDSEASLEWLMTVRHPRLNGSRPFKVEGVSLLRFNAAGLVSYHRDYYDLGSLLYERIPLLGRVISSLKERLAS